MNRLDMRRKIPPHIPYCDKLIAKILANLCVSVYNGCKQLE